MDLQLVLKILAIVVLPWSKFGPHLWLSPHPFSTSTAFYWFLCFSGDTQVSLSNKNVSKNLLFQPFYFNNVNSYDRPIVLISFLLTHLDLDQIWMISKFWNIWISSCQSHKLSNKDKHHRDNKEIILQRTIWLKDLIMPTWVSWPCPPYNYLNTKH